MDAATGSRARTRELNPVTLPTLQSQSPSGWIYTRHTPTISLSCFEDFSFFSLEPETYMAKSTKKSDKKSKKEALTSKLKKQRDAVSDKLSGHLHDVQQDVQNQLGELDGQIKKLKKELKKPALKLVKKIEKRYNKQLKALQKDVDKRLAALQKTQERILAQLPDEISSKLGKKDAEKPSPRRTPKRPVVAQKGPGIADIKGVGPVLQQKLNDAGITQLSQIAQPTKQDQAALQAFSSSRGFSSWQAQASKLLAQ